MKDRDDAVIASTVLREISGLAERAFPDGWMRVPHETSLWIARRT